MLKIIFPREQTHHFHINRTNVVRSFKQNQLSSPSIKINKKILTPVQCLTEQVQVQKPIQVAATDQMPDHS